MHTIFPYVGTYLQFGRCKKSTKKKKNPQTHKKTLPTMGSILGFLSNLGFVDVDFALSVSWVWSTDSFANKLEN